MRCIAKWSLSLYPRPLPLSYTERCIVKKSLSLEKEMSTLSSTDLRNKVSEIQQQLRENIHVTNAIIQGLALVREAAFRAVGKRHYPVQLLAGVALFHGSFVEMATGEGKTLTATLPVSLWALYGRGVHVLTTNSYLAQRDFALMSPVYKKLGLKVGLLQEQDSPQQKRYAYSCDVTYGVGSEYGFDYMRDQLNIINRRQLPLGQNFVVSLRGYKQRQVFRMQREHAFALIDEVDSVLIDEARSPLVISGSQGGPAKDAYIFQTADDVVREMERTVDYTVDFRTKKIELTAVGVQKMYEKKIPKGLLYPWSFYIKQGLNAYLFFKRDVHYIIDDGKVVIVDEFTGRRFAERTWRDGLHQAVEAKEKVQITDASKSVASITRQRYFSLYETIAGMTGTAQGSEKEIWQFYRVPVICIPRNKPLRRVVVPDRVFGSLRDKWNAVVEKVLEIHSTGQPVLIGTRTIESSEYLANRLQKLSLNVAVLNAKQDAEEAAIVSRAGQKNAITIATNMAGRGTDIHLGEGVEELGGLFVLGTERHESRRVDNQLIGRCARQGNPGYAQFFVSFEDDLIMQHAPKLSAKLKSKGTLPQKYTTIFKKLQCQLDLLYFEQRKKMFHYDDWIEEILKKIG